MAKNLVIVESPSKSKTIEKYLGSNYKVVASMGHIRDLATSGKFGLGVDVDNNFKPDYIPMKGKNKVIKDLKQKVKDSDYVYLATDPDREGEAISWHLEKVLGLKKDYSRVTFNEITKDVVQEAFKNPRDIDQDLVASQEARRILDRIIGFRLSRVISTKVPGAESAGRVQSVALKLIVDREREIEAFVPEEYWDITAKFDGFDAKLAKYKNEKFDIHSEEEANKVLNELGPDYHINNIETKEKKKSSVMPFKTSTLQQAAINKLGFTSKKTMSVAQALYEGKDIGNETVGLITYMRTDSERISPQFVNEAFKYIKDNYGEKYVGYVKKSKKNENMQDAHEGIRVTSLYRSPESIKEYLSNDEYKLYSLIYARSLASLMADAKIKATSVSLLNNDYEFRATGSILIFDGYLKAYNKYESSEDTILPELKEKEVLTAQDVEKEQHFTKPEPRYTEASLVKKLEELGIGRPSTYATIIDTNKNRKYVVVEDKKLKPTELGIKVTDKLQEGFKDYINTEYTAEMEEDLDEIADKKVDEVKLLNDFWGEFEPLVEKNLKEMEKIAPEETGELCPECGKPLVIRNGRFGEFTACSNYPECKYIKKDKQEIVEVCDCPNCGGKIIERKSHKGKVFYGCNNYPKCKTAYWDKPTGEKCPECGSLLVEHNKTIKCSNCSYEK